MLKRPIVKLPAFCFHNLAMTKRQKSRRFPRLLRSRGAMFHQQELHHQTDNNEPPQTPDRVCQIGSYCMRAFTQLHDSKNDVIREYNGFDEDTSIVDKVVDVCERDIHRFGKQYRCAPARLFFLGPVEHCDGRVNIFDLKHNTVSVIM